MFKMVVMKLIELKIEEAPAKCSEKIAKSTLAPAWDTTPARGG
jgi:hypothetical protein